MKKKRLKPTVSTPKPLPKAPSGIRGLDEITAGGLPRGRPTLVCGGAGTGKTLFGMEFLVRGAIDYGEPGVFLTFEERPVDLAANSASLGFEIEAMISRKQLVVEQIAVGRSEIVETGEYDLDGLFIRLEAAIRSIGAKRVVLDTIEVLFSALTNLGVLRSELQRLFSWLKQKGMTTIVTGERGNGSITRHGLEEYVSDCVILLDQRVTDEIATRRLRVVKYRGSVHGTNEYPFLIDEHGFVVLPITAIKLDYRASKTFVSTGIAGLDAMLRGSGFYRGSTAMVSGGPGTGKTSLAAHFVDAACRRRERALYFAFEESPSQLMRNMRSIGIDLGKWVESGLLKIAAARPATYGFELHISMMLKALDEFQPEVVVMDPISSFDSGGTMIGARSMLMRMIDVLKARQRTVLFTDLGHAGETLEQTDVGISSLIDTWIVVRNLEQNSERARTLTVMKSRGIKHSNQVREIILTDRGVTLEDVYVGPNGVLIGGAKTAQQLDDRVSSEMSRQQVARHKALLAQKEAEFDARKAELKTAHLAEIREIKQTMIREQSTQQTSAATRRSLALQRQGSSASATRRPNGGAK